MEFVFILWKPKRKKCSSKKVLPVLASFFAIWPSVAKLVIYNISGILMYQLKIYFRY